MWITTKSIVKEIKKNQEDLAEKLEKVAVEQRDNSVALQKQISVLTEKLDCLEKLNMEDRVNKTKAVLDCIQESIDKVCERLKSAVGQSENNLREGLKQIKDCSASDGEKNTALLMDGFTAKFAQVEKLLQDMGNEVGHETRNYCDKVYGELEHISCEIQNIASLAESQETVMSENVETMNIAMQEIMRNLLSLDEGNRLVIAKLLLRDME